MSYTFDYVYSNIQTSSQHKGATESDLRREFEGFGSIERVRIVRDKKGRSRGYAFIVFERERDMKGKVITAQPELVLTSTNRSRLPTIFTVYSCLQRV